MLGLVSAVMAICERSGAPRPPSPRLVLLYATCSLDKWHLSPYNDAVFYTPNLGRFAREAAVFTAHGTESGLSGTSYASLFTGVQADRHGVFSHPGNLADELFLIFEAFNQAGFETFYWAGHPMATAELKYAQGVPSHNVFVKPLTAKDKTFRSILDRVRSDPTYRALVVTAFSETHGPYALEDARSLAARYPKETPEIAEADMVRYYSLYEEHFIPLQTRFDETVRELGLSPQDVSKLATILELAYEGGVNRLDGMFGSITKALVEQGVDHETAVAFTADHGETLYREDRPFKWTHGPDLPREVIEVPLMIRWPGVIRPRPIDHVTRSIDVYPTLAGLAGVDLPREAKVDGQDLSSALREASPFPRLRAYSHETLRQWSFFVPDLIENVRVSMRVEDLRYMWLFEDSRWRFVAQHIGRRQGEDAPLDTEEPHHRAAAADLWRYRERLLRAFYHAYPDQARTKGDALSRLTPEQAEVLRSLGYIEWRGVPRRSIPGGYPPSSR